MADKPVRGQAPRQRLERAWSVRLGRVNLDARYVRVERGWSCGAAQTAVSSRSLAALLLLRSAHHAHHVWYSVASASVFAGSDICWSALLIMRLRAMRNSRIVMLSFIGSAGHCEGCFHSHCGVGALISSTAAVSVRTAARRCTLRTSAAIRIGLCSAGVETAVACGTSVGISVMRLAQRSAGSALGLNRARSGVKLAFSWVLRWVRDEPCSPAFVGRKRQLCGQRAVCL